MALLAVLLAVLASTGCVRRRLFVNSNPTGALVYVDNEQIGTTPCAVDFTYYGTREVRLVKPGFETLTFNQPIPTPWYEYPPIDFVSENLVPSKIRDNRSVTYNLVPQVIVPQQELIARGEQLRQETQAVVPAAATAPVVPGAPVVLPEATPTIGPPALVTPQPASSSPAVVLPPPVSQPPSTQGPPVSTPQSAAPVVPQRGRPIVSPPLR